MGYVGHNNLFILHFLMTLFVIGYQVLVFSSEGMEF